MAPRVALAAPGPGQRLVHVLDGEHAEAARHARQELHVHESAGALAADVGVVRRLAADDRAARRYAGEAPALGAVPRRERQLVGAEDVEDVDLAAGLLEDAAGGRDQLLGQVL